MQRRTTSSFESHSQAPLILPERKSHVERFLDFSKNGQNSLLCMNDLDRKDALSIGILISALFLRISFDLHAPTRRYIHQMRALSQLVLLIYRSCSGNLGKKSSKKSWKSADQLMTGSNLTMSMRKRFRKFLQMISSTYREFGRRYLFLFLIFLIFRRSEMIMPKYSDELTKTE